LDMDRMEKIVLGVSVFLIVFGLGLIAFWFLWTLPASPLYMAPTETLEKFFPTEVMPKLMLIYGLLSLGCGIGFTVVAARDRLRRRRENF